MCMLSWVDGLVRPIVTMREVRTHVTRVFVPCHKDAALFATAMLHQLVLGMGVVLWSIQFYINEPSIVRL